MLNENESVVSHANPAEPLELTDRSLDHPSYSSEAVSEILYATSADRFDGLRTQGVPSCLAVVSPIYKEDIRSQGSGDEPGAATARPLPSESSVSRSIGTSVKVSVPPPIQRITIRSMAGWAPRPKWSRVPKCPW